MSNIPVTSITNQVRFSIDQTSFKRALNAIRRVGSEWAKVQAKMGGAFAAGRGIGGGGGGGTGRGGRGNSVGPQPFRPSVATRKREAAEAREAAKLQRTSDRNANTISSGVIGKDTNFLKAYSSQIGILNQQLKAGIITNSQYNKHLSSMARDFRNAQNSARGFGGTLKDLRGDFVALTASYTAFAGAKSIMQTGQFFQATEAGMTMASPDAKAAQEQLKFLREEAYRLGLDLKIAATGFTQMSVASKDIMNQGQIQELFTGLSEYSTALGVDAFRYEKAVLAIGQMANKQQIMAEELKGQ